MSFLYFLGFPSSMTPPLGLSWGSVFILLTLSILALLAFARSATPSRRFRAFQAASYTRQRYLFTKDEWTFYQTLKEAVQSELLIMGKIRMADLLAVDRRKVRASRARFSAFAKISSKHIDYTLVDPSSGRIILCIELDDKSHQRQDRKDRDKFVNEAFRSSQLPLLRIRTAGQYDALALRQQIMSVYSR